MLIYVKINVEFCEDILRYQKRIVLERKKMIIDKNKIAVEKVEKPYVTPVLSPIEISESTMEERRKKVLQKMEEYAYDVLVVYADREHGGNFGYLTGFEPRFEEAVLVFHKQGKMYLLLGNEMLRMAQYSRIKGEAIHVPYFSLPNQPMETKKNLKELFSEAGLKKRQNIGIVGWKIFTSPFENNARLFDVPSFIVDTVMGIAGEETVRNATELFVSSDGGARSTVNANEAAYFEFYAALASERMLDMMDHICVGKDEMELASYLERYGQLHSVQTICASGERFTNGIVEPRRKKICLGDKFSASVGYKGGFTNRCGYVVHDRSQMGESVRDYLEKMAKPYYAALATWYSIMGTDITGGEIYETINRILPKEDYGWTLNPGHLIGTEEWMSSPIYPESEIVLQSGMMLQADIIIKVEGYGGINGEDGILLADTELREEIRVNYPETWERMQQRRSYMEQELGIILKREVLPMSNICGYVRPYLLDKEKSLKVKGSASS